MRKERRWISGMIMASGVGACYSLYADGCPGGRWMPAVWHCDRRRLSIWPVMIASNAWRVYRICLPRV